MSLDTAESTLPSGVSVKKDMGARSSAANILSWSRVTAATKAE